jgi:hypothetical protein
MEHDGESTHLSRAVHSITMQGSPRESISRTLFEK